MWRHGEAGPAVRDRQRQLTARGRRDVPRGAQALVALCGRRQLPTPDLLWFSCWQRTTQTAALIGAVTGCSASAHQALIPGSEPLEVECALERLFGTGTPRHLVLVSHQPLVSELVDYLSGETGATPSHPPGGLVTLALDAPAPGCASVLWWAFPPHYEAGL
ncbi:MAG: SixA phosphatase family protein [Parahaliea sp.]